MNNWSRLSKKRNLRKSTGIRCSSQGIPAFHQKPLQFPSAKIYALESYNPSLLARNMQVYTRQPRWMSSSFLMRASKAFRMLLHRINWLWMFSIFAPRSLLLPLLGYVEAMWRTAGKWSVLVDTAEVLCSKSADADTVLFTTTSKSGHFEERMSVPASTINSRTCPQKWGSDPPK